MSGKIDVVIRQPGFPDRVIPLQEGRVRLGRADDNEIVLSDVGVSRRHAQIVVDSGQVSIEDLGSGNGTYYYGQRVKSQLVRDQDEVVIDPFVLQFQIAGAPGGIAPPALMQAAPQDAARIEVVVGNGMVGSLFPIVDGLLTMGRAEDRDVVVPDPASSRHHCQITLEGSEYVLHDNGSANGVFVNAVRVRECTLSNGDLIRIGNTEMRFVNPAAAHAPTRDLGDPAGWAAEPPSVAGVLPIEPSNDPVATVLKSSTTSQRRLDRDADVEETSAGSNAPMIAAALGGLVFVGAMLLLVTVVGAGAVYYVSNPVVTVAEIPERPPTWTLDLDALPASTNQQLTAEGTQAAEARDYEKTLESFYRVLQSQPGDPTAMKFSVFAGELLVTEALQAELKERLETERRRVERRARLIRDLEGSNYSRQRDARSTLIAEYRDDPFMIAWTEENPRAMGASWGLTNTQLNHRSQLERLEREVQADQFDKAVRSARRLLQETTEVELRDRAREHLVTAEARLAEQVAEMWRQAVRDEALAADREVAVKGFKAVLAADQTNVSALAHVELLEGRP